MNQQLQYESMNQAMKSIKKGDKLAKKYPYIYVRVFLSFKKHWNVLLYFSKRKAYRKPTNKYIVEEKFCILKRYNNQGDSLVP